MVHSRLIEAANESENFMTPMVIEMKKKFDKYWTDYSTILSCAAVLDPRYKLEFISYCYNKLYGDDGQHRVDLLKQTLQSLFDGYRGSVLFYLLLIKVFQRKQVRMENLTCSLIMIYSCVLAGLLKRNHNWKIIWLSQQET